MIAAIAEKTIFNKERRRSNLEPTLIQIVRTSSYSEKVNMKEVRMRKCQFVKIPYFFRE